MSDKPHRYSEVVEKVRAGTMSVACAFEILGRDLDSLFQPDGEMTAASLVSAGSPSLVDDVKKVKDGKK